MALKDSHKTIRFMGHILTMAKRTKNLGVKQIAAKLLRLDGEVRTFTHAETLEITGLTNDALQLYHKRGLLPQHDFPVAQLGKGNRRSYSLQQIAVLAVARELIDMGVPVRDAMIIASTDFGRNKPTPEMPFNGLVFSLSSLVISYLSGTGSEESILQLVERLRDGPRAIFAAFKVKEGGRIEGVGVACAESFGVVQLAGESILALTNLMRRIHVRCTVIIDLNSVAVSLVSGVLRVAETKVEAA